MRYKPSFKKLRSPIKLFKPTKQLMDDIAQDYELSTFTESPVEVSVFEGNHITLLRSTQVAQAINELLDSGSTPQFFKASVVQDVGKRESALIKEV